MNHNVTEEDYHNIREKIIDYLSRQGFSEKKLLQKVCDLKRRYPKTVRYTFYTPKHVQKVLDEMKHEGLVNDYTYAKSVLRQLKDNKDGVQRIRSKMFRRLIDPRVIEKVIAEFDAKGRPQDLSRIVRETKRKHERLKEKAGTKKEQYLIPSKLYAFLAQKGYLPDDITEILEKAGLKK